MKDCIFCKIVKGSSPAYVIWEDENNVAFLSIFPNTPGFSIVATKKHLPSYVFDNNDEVIKNLIIATKKTSKLIKDAFSDVARCGVIFEGYGVDHLHSKIFPMHGTTSRLDWKKLEKDMPHVFYEKYPGYLSSHGSKRADDDELKRVADRITKNV